MADVQTIMRHWAELLEEQQACKASVARRKRHLQGGLDKGQELLAQIGLVEEEIRSTTKTLKEAEAAVELERVNLIAHKNNIENLNWQIEEQDVVSQRQSMELGRDEARLTQVNTRIDVSINTMLVVACTLTLTPQARTKRHVSSSSGLFADRPNPAVSYTMNGVESIEPCISVEQAQQTVAQHVEPFAIPIRSTQSPKLDGIPPPLVQTKQESKDPDTKRPIATNGLPSEIADFVDACPVIIRTASNGDKPFIELHCPECGCNAIQKSNIGTYMRGLTALSLHITKMHPGSASAWSSRNPTKRLELITACTKRALSETEVLDIVNGLVEKPIVIRSTTRRPHLNVSARVSCGSEFISSTANQEDCANASKKRKSTESASTDDDSASRDAKRPCQDADGNNGYSCQPTVDDDDDESLFVPENPKPQE